MSEIDAQIAALDNFLGDSFGYYEKNAEGYYIAMSDNNRKFGGIPLDLDLTKAKVTDHDLPFHDMAEEIIETDKQILATGEPYRAYAWLRNEKGHWMKIFSMKQRTPQGTLLGYSFLVGFTGKVGLWVRRLDYKRELLLLDDKGEHYLTRKELQILYLFIDGLPRKEMAQRMYLSLKSIEKYLARIRGKIKASCCPGKESSLQRCLNHSGLTAFLLEKPDWFEDTHHSIVVARQPTA